jgi:hypothetical protein
MSSTTAIATVHRRVCVSDVTHPRKRPMRPKVLWAQQSEEGANLAPRSVILILEETRVLAWQCNKRNVCECVSSSNLVQMMVFTVITLMQRRAGSA